MKKEKGREDAERGTVKAERNSASQEPKAAQDESLQPGSQGIIAVLRERLPHSWLHSTHRYLLSSKDGQALF